MNISRRTFAGLILGFSLAAIAFAADPAALEEMRMKAGVKGFPHPGAPILLDSAGSASEEQLAAQYQRLLGIESAKVWYDGRGVAHFVSGRTRQFLPGNPESAEGREQLENLIAWLRPLLLSEGTEALRFERLNESKNTRTIFLVESIRGIPVHGARIALISRANSGEITTINGSFLPDRDLPRESRVSADEALRIAHQWLLEKAKIATVPLIQRDSTGNETQLRGPAAHIPDLGPTPDPSLRYYMGSIEANPTPPRLVWVVELVERNGLPYKAVFIDSQDGSVIGATDAAT